MTKDGYLPLFETKEAKGRMPFLLYVVSVFVGICFICVYRVSHTPEKGGVQRWAWKGMFLSELWFILYWIITITVRWRPIYRYPFKDRLSYRYEKDLPEVDIFVCTADPMSEPPIMVVNTVLSVMAYNYPPEKLSVYLSDDGGSDLTFYALLEASRFSKVWLPFCKKFKVEPRSPAAYFNNVLEPFDDDDPLKAKEWSSIKNMYEDMKNRVESTAKLGRISESIRKEHKGFSEWDMVYSRHDHQTILQILIDGRDPKAIDIEGQALPTLVYLSREKRPKFHHQFKAGAMNALIRVSSGISNGSIILNVDCDMYSNNSESVRDALCFIMDEEKGHEIAYVQFPQTFNNLTENDIYGSSFRVINMVDHPGCDGNGGPCYIGTGCFHRRETLCGKIYNSKECKGVWLRSQNERKVDGSAIVLEETCKNLASCTYEDNTQWGKEMGLKYGCPVEDIITGLSIQCRGWKSIYFNPEREGFLGLAPTTLLQTLVQHKRWSEDSPSKFLSPHQGCPSVGLVRFRQQADVLRVVHVESKWRRDLRQTGVHPRVIAHIRSAGFIGLFSIRFRSIDWGLITALVERWRPETHTFHFPIGECTVTLQDVQVLLGLRVDGLAVTSPLVRRDRNAWVALCGLLMGFTPTRLDGSKIYISDIREHLRARAQIGFTPDDPDMLYQQDARCIIMLLIGSLFPDKASNLVHLMYLPLLESLEDAGMYSWGGACLAFLYRSLCTSSLLVSGSIGGPLILLQYWAWERIRTIRPTVVRGRVLDADVFTMPSAPRGRHWADAHISQKETIIITMLAFRDLLDRMTSDQMTWQPYTQEILETLPVYCTSDPEVWRTRAPLICFHIVEWHLPDRVFRQFGMQQHIPAPCDTVRALHGIDLRAREIDWSTKHAGYIELWEQRRASIVEEALSNDELGWGSEYMRWYLEITRILIGPLDVPESTGGYPPVASIRERMVQGLARVTQLSQQGRLAEPAAQTLEDVYLEASQSLYSAGQSHRVAPYAPAGDTPYIYTTHTHGDIGASSSYVHPGMFHGQSGPYSSTPMDQSQHSFPGIGGPSFYQSQFSSQGGLIHPRALSYSQGQDMTQGWTLPPYHHPDSERTSHIAFQGAAFIPYAGPPFSSSHPETHQTPYTPQMFQEFSGHGEPSSGHVAMDPHSSLDTWFSPDEPIFPARVSSDFSDVPSPPHAHSPVPYVDDEPDLSHAQGHAQGHEHHYITTRGRVSRRPPCGT